MADIKQAAIWMREGKRVRRPIQGPMTYFATCESEGDEFIEFGLNGKQGMLGGQFQDMLDIDDLLADDWEIALAEDGENSTSTD